MICSREFSSCGATTSRRVQTETDETGWIDYFNFEAGFTLRATVALLYIT